VVISTFTSRSSANILAPYFSCLNSARTSDCLLSQHRNSNKNGFVCHQKYQKGGVLQRLLKQIEAGGPNGSSETWTWNRNVRYTALSSRSKPIVPQELICINRRYNCQKMVAFTAWCTRLSFLRSPHRP